MDHWFSLRNSAVRRSPCNTRLLHVEPDREIIADGQAERFEIGGRNIELDVAKCVDPQHAPTHSAISSWFSQWDEEWAYRAGIEYRSEVIYLCLTGREHCSSGAEDIASGKGAARRRQLIQSLFERHYAVRATDDCNCWRQEPIVRSNEKPNGRTGCYCSPVCANARVDNREKYTIWHELDSPCECHCATVDIPVRNAVGDIDDSGGRSDSGNDPVHNTYELIFVAEVAEKRDWSIHRLKA